MSTPADVMLSYSLRHQDPDEQRRLQPCIVAIREGLQRGAADAREGPTDVHVFHDVRMTTGQRFGERIEAACRSALALVLVVTHDLSASRWCEQELAWFGERQAAIGADRTLPLCFGDPTRLELRGLMKETVESTQRTPPLGRLGRYVGHERGLTDTVAAWATHHLQPRLAGGTWLRVADALHDAEVTTPRLLQAAAHYTGNGQPPSASRGHAVRAQEAAAIRAWAVAAGTRARWVRSLQRAFPRHAGTVATLVTDVTWPLA